MGNPEPSKPAPLTSHAFVIAGLVAAVIILVTFAGWALLQEKLKGVEYVAIASGLFGLIGGGAIGYSAGRSPQRATDASGPTQTTTVSRSVVETATEPAPQEDKP